MTNRRSFVARSTAVLGAAALAPRSLFAHDPHAVLERVDEALAARGRDVAPDVLAEDEAFWAEVRRGYVLRPDIVNLDHGWTNPTPEAAFDELVRRARELQSLPAERLANMWTEFTNTTVRAALAGVMGVPPDSIAFVRNATEALNTVLLGVPLHAGDEIVCSTHDYFAMLDALEQRRARDGVLLRMVDPPVPAPSMDALATLYEATIGPRTRLVLLTNPSNLTGQMLPVRRIADAAHRVGAEVVIDGAQSLGLHEESITDFGCDYYGASLHKWLSVPVGTGVLWMRPEHMPKVWPIVPPPAFVSGMARFEWIGTSPEYVSAAAMPALDLHNRLGPARKAARLRYLTTYWRSRAAAALPQARFYTSDDAAMSCGLCTIEVPGMDAEALQARLLADHRILVQAMTGNALSTGIRGLRVTPNVFTAPAELDAFVTALGAAVAAGG